MAKRFRRFASVDEPMKDLDTAYYANPRRGKGSLEVLKTDLRNKSARRQRGKLM